MKNENRNLKKTDFIRGIILMLLIPILFASCKKDEPKFTPSERQLYTFTQGESGFALNPPTLVNNYIYIGTSRGCTYVGTNDNAFYKLDDHLNKVWEYPLGTVEVKGAATLDEFGNIYFVTGAGVSYSTISDNTAKLLSLDNNGNFRWSKIIDSIHSSNQIYGLSSPAISVENVIYVGGAKFYAFDINGNELWNYVPYNDADIITSPIIDPSGNIYLKAQQYSLITLETSFRELISLDKDGHERWRALSGNNCWKSSPAFSVDYSKIFFATYNKLFCLNSSDGSIVWEYSIPGMSGDFRGTPAVDNNNNIYIGTHGEYNDDNRQTLYAIKGDGSGVIWQTNIGADLYSSPALGNDGILYIGSEDYFSRNGYKRLHALSMATGEIIWSASLAMDITWSSAVISNAGILYIATMGGESDGEEDTDRRGAVYGFSTGSTGLLQNAGSPRFHEGNTSTGRRD